MRLFFFANCLTFFLVFNALANQQKTFDITRYMGQWYEIARKPNRFEKGDFGFAFYQSITEKTFAIKNQETRKGYIIHQVNGKGQITKKPGKFLIQFSNNFFQKFFKAKYEVIATDYDHYAIVYSKTKYLFFFDVVLAWILCREPCPTEAQKKIWFAQLKNLTGIERDAMYEPQQSSKYPS